jgi:hypothetical protein
MAGICDVCNDFYSREHVRDLRDDMQNKFHLSDNKIELYR